MITTVRRVLFVAVGTSRTPAVDTAQRLYTVGINALAPDDLWTQQVLAMQLARGRLRRDQSQRGHPPDDRRGAHGQRGGREDGSAHQPHRRPLDESLSARADLRSARAGLSPIGDLEPALAHRGARCRVHRGHPGCRLPGERRIRRHLRRHQTPHLVIADLGPVAPGTASVPAAGADPGCARHYAPCRPATTLALRRRSPKLAAPTPSSMPRTSASRCLVTTLGPGESRCASTSRTLSECRGSEPGGDLAARRRVRVRQPRRRRPDLRPSRVARRASSPGLACCTGSCAGDP